MRSPGGGLLTARRVVMAVVVVAAAFTVSLVSGPVFRHPAADAPPSIRAQTLSTTALVRAERQSGLLADEDSRLLALVSSVRPGSGPYVQDVDGTDTLVLPPSGSDYGLADLRALGAVQMDPQGNVLLTRNLFIAPGARLDVTAPGKTLRLRSDPSGFVSVVAWKADLVLEGAEGAPLRVTSWAPGARGPDQSETDGRAYIRDVGGSMSLRHVDVADLGFWAGRTSGVAWTGSARRPATGSIEQSSFRSNHYGAFVSQARWLTVTGSAFDDNEVDGLALHRGTTDVGIRDSSARHNGRDGFSADQASESITYSAVTAAGNTAHGLFYSGAPLSTGPSAHGASLQTYGQVQVTGGRFLDNGGSGVRIDMGSGIDITRARVQGNRDGITLVGTSTPTTVEGTQLQSGQRFGISVDRGTAVVRVNRVAGAGTAIRVRDGAVAVTANVIRSATEHGISVVGAADGTTVRGNAIAGRGSSGLDLYRLAPGAVVDQAANDTGRWTRHESAWSYWSSFVPRHPVVLLSLLIIVLPVVLSLRGHRRRVQIGTMPYRDALRRDWPAPLRVDGGRPVGASGAPA